MKDDSDNFLSFNGFQIKFNLKACPLKYYGLLSALKSLWSTCQNNSNNNSVYESFSSKILKPLSGSRLIYKKLLSSKCITPPSQNKWLKSEGTDFCGKKQTYLHFWLYREILASFQSFQGLYFKIRQDFGNILENRFRALGGQKIPELIGKNTFH